MSAFDIQTPTVIIDIDEEKMARRKEMFAEKETGTDWDRQSSGVGHQMRLDIYIDDPVSMRKQAEILMRFAREMHQFCSSPTLSVRTIWLECRLSAHQARGELEAAAPSQQLRVQMRKQPRK